MHLSQECKLIGDLAIHFANYEAIRDKFKLKYVTGYTDTYWIPEYDQISAGKNCDKTTNTYVTPGAISSSDCQKKCEDDVHCIVYATKENPEGFWKTYSKCDIAEGETWGGKFFRKKKLNPGYFYQTEPSNYETNSGLYNQAKECINLNDPTDETSNKHPNVVSRK